MVLGLRSRADGRVLAGPRFGPASQGQSRFDSARDGTKRRAYLGDSGIGVIDEDEGRDGKKSPPIGDAG